MTFKTDIPGAEVLPSKKFWAGRKDEWPVTAVIQHYTASLSERGLVKWMASDDAANSAHIFNFRNGHVVQMVSFSDRAFHAGEKMSKGFWPAGTKQPANVNHFSIGIENCNAGFLLKQGKNFYLPKKTSSGYVVGRPYKGPEPKQALDHLGTMRWWEPYTDKQVASNIEILKRIVDMYPDVAAQGVGFHSDVSPHRKFDPGPLWPHEYVIDEVFGSSSYVPDMANASEPEEDDDEVFDFSTTRSVDNIDGENSYWYDHDAQMCMIEPEE